MPVRRPAVTAVLVGLLMALALTATPAQSAAAAPGDVLVEVLSNRADLVSGGDALVRVTVPASAEGTVVSLDGTPVQTLEADTPSTLTGLVSGLRVGENVLTAQAPDGRGARITITNHPSGGPVLAGEQVQPWICDNASGGNGEPVDAQCTTEPSYELVYRAAPGVFRPYDPASPPAVLPTTTTDQGQAVPYVVRVENGTMDRGNYRIGVLWDVEADRPTAWNHKLVVPFGASTAVHHGSGAPTTVLDDKALSRGFLVANNSLNIHGQNANDVVSAEAVMMLKERIVEQYGTIRYTIGNGCSGGAIQQHMLTSMYPGLLDGIQPNCSYTDVFTTAPDVVDCHLLLHYFNSTSPELWPDERQRAAVDGHKDASDCVAWEATFAGSLEPSKASNCALPQEQVYDENTNPDGVRCTIPDYMVSVLGRRPQQSWTDVEQQIGRGFAQVPVDTVGVQYGLVALKAGSISPAQFVDLNEKIGGITVDDDFTGERIAGDLGAIETVYRTGQISDPLQWAQVPIIDLRGYSETAEIHTSFYTSSARARLDKALGHHDNQIVWTYAPTAPIAPIPTPAMSEKAFLLLDRWLAEMEADTRDVPKAQKVVDAKPDDARDACFLADVEQPAAACPALYPPYATPRVAAEGPVANDVVKCTLAPLDPADYPVEFSAEQWTSLQSAFPTGVCDYQVDGVAQAPSVPWQSYATGPGGQALGPPPASIPFRSSPSRGDAPGVGGRLAATGALEGLTGLAAVLLGLAAVALRRRPSV